MENYQWQGEPIKATFGYCKIYGVSESHKWYGYELSLGITTIPAVKMNLAYQVLIMKMNNFVLLLPILQA